MKLKYTWLYTVVFLSMIYAPASLAILINFSAADMASLDGLTSGNLVVDGVNVEIQAGEFDQSSSSFILGGSDSTLAYIAPDTFATYGIEEGGLGVDSTIPSGTGPELARGVTIHEAVQFLFDPVTAPGEFTLPTMVFVGIQVYSDGMLVDEREGNHTETLTFTFDDPISNLTFTRKPRYGSSDPVFLFAAVNDTTSVPEPSTLLMLLSGAFFIPRFLRKTLT